MRGAEVDGGPEGRGPELVVVGHVGTSIVHTGTVSWTCAGGSVSACWVTRYCSGVSFAIASGSLR